MNKIGLSVPENYKKEFDIEIYGNNFYRLKYISIILLVLESIIFIFRDSFFNTGNTILGFVIFDVVMIPILWYCHSKHAAINKNILEIVQYVYSLAILFFGMGLAFIAQNYSDLVHMYFMMIFGVAFFLYIKPLPCLFLLGVSYTFFFLLIPHYQENPDIVLIIRVNALAVNIFSWIVSRFLFGLRVNLFLDRMLIIDKNNELQELVMRDSMTKLYNHETAMRLLGMEIKRCGKNRSVSVLLADIDRFKQINDKYGHVTGDQVIKAVAGAIESVMRASDYVCRYGGDEFFVIMPDTDLQSAYACARRIQSAIKNIDFEMDDISITLSGGISQYNGETVKTLIAATDAKLYCAKKAGKDNFK